MNEILIQALLARIKAGHMTIEQAPIPYQEVVEQKLHEGGQYNGMADTENELASGRCS